MSPESSGEFADARTSPLGDFPGVQTALDTLDQQLKDLEVGMGQVAIGLTDVLKNYDSLSSSVAGSYRSLENRIGDNIDPDVFAGVWDGIQYIKDKYGSLESVVQGIIR